MTNLGLFSVRLNFPPCFSVPLLNHACIFQTMGAPRNEVHLWSITYTEALARRHISPADLHNLHRWQHSQSLGCVFISGKSRYLGVTRSLAFPPTSRPHSCSCNEAEHHRYVREESFVWPPETSTQIFTSPITVYTSPAW